MKSKSFLNIDLHVVAMFSISILQFLHYVTQQRISLSPSHKIEIFKFLQRNRVRRKSKNSQENWTELTKKPGKRGDTN